MSAQSLAAAVTALGVPCVVEAIGGFALVTVTGGQGIQTLGEPARRRELASLAREFGFSHVALEITDTVAGASLPRD
ncbi:MAG: hypothetical protein NVS1B4_11220 [Gemmatimonadaceae bacterium]